jgi:hypothetical protein
LPTLSASPKKGSTITITVTTDSLGWVRFLASGRRIAGCVSVATVGSSGSANATCNWKPSSSGEVTLSAIIFPADTNYQSATSLSLKTVIGRRSNTR